MHKCENVKIWSGGKNLIHKCENVKIWSGGEKFNAQM